MTFFPAGYDCRDLMLGGLDLCEVDTADGVQRFMIGTDGIFKDVNRRNWVGSQLISASSLGAALNGEAPSGSITLSFFQDPKAKKLITEIRDLGLDYVAGRAIRFFYQPLRTQEEFYKPEIAPLQWTQRTMRTLTFSVNGAQDRSITLSFEAWSEDRRAARRIILNTEGHATIIGEANPSLEFMPTSDFEEEKLFG